jgi:hypothetical protein
LEILVEAEFLADFEKEVVSPHEELSAGSYRHGGYHYFTIHEVLLVLLRRVIGDERLMERIGLILESHAQRPAAGVDAGRRLVRCSDNLLASNRNNNNPTNENNNIGPARGKLLTSGQEHGDLIGQISRGLQQLRGPCYAQELPGRPAYRSLDR